MGHTVADSRESWCNHVVQQVHGVLGSRPARIQGSDLLDPRLAGRPVSAIAYACGFGDLSGFNRAFKQAYAVSPRELRNASTSTAEPRR